MWHDSQKGVKRTYRKNTLTRRGRSFVRSWLRTYTTHTKQSRQQRSSERPRQIFYRHLISLKFIINFRDIVINSTARETLPMEIIYDIVTDSLTYLWKKFISLVAVDISPLIKFRPLWNFYRHMDDFKGSPSSWRCLLLLRSLLGIQLEVSLSEYWSLSVVFGIVYLCILQAWNRDILRPF
jgi:hypothetical protein